jgi:Cep192 domain 4/Beta-propeller repeat
MRSKLSVLLFTLLLLALPVCVAGATGVLPAQAAKSAVPVSFNLPLSFEPAATPGRYLAHSGNYSVFIGAGESSIVVADGKSAPHTIRFAFEKASPAASIEPLEQKGVTNYYIGNDPKDWRLSVKNFARLRTKQVYPGVDVVFYGDQRQLEFDFVVAPNADPTPIALAFSGTDKLYVSGGDLVAEQAGHAVHFVKPFAYQLLAGKKSPVDAAYVLDGAGNARLHIGDYDKDRELVIDPVLSYATYLGGSLSDTANGIAVDATGNAYVTGQTCSTTFPVSTSLDGSCYAFVSKLSFDDATNVTTLGFTDFFGGENTSGNPTSTSGNGIAVDKASPVNVYAVGTTNFKKLAGALPNPVGRPNAYNGGDSDAFVVILNSADGSLVRSTYLGGGNSDLGYGIAVDSQQNLTAVGSTCSLDFPTYNGFQAQLEDCAGFATKLDFGLHIAPPIVPGTSAVSPRPLSATEACEASGQLCPVTPDPSTPYYFYSAIYNGQLNTFPPAPTWPLNAGGSINGAYTSGVDVPQGAITVATPHCPGVDPLGTKAYPAQVLISNSTGIPDGLDWQGGMCTCLTKGCAVGDGGGFDWVVLGLAPVPPNIPVHASTEAYGVALDPAGDAFVVGGTNTPSLVPYSTWSTITGPWIMKLHGQDENGYHAGDAVYSSGLGSIAESPTRVNAANAVAVDLGGQAYVVGTVTTGAGIGTTPGAPNPSYLGGNEDAFLLILDNPGQHIMYGTYLGGTGTDQGLGVTVDSSAIYVVGNTTSPSTGMTIMNPLYDTDAKTTESDLRGPQDAYLAKFTAFNPNGTGGEILMSAYLGGSSFDSANAVAVDPKGTGDMYVAGSTSSATFPVKYPVAGQASSSGGGDAFVAMVSGASFPAASVTPTSLGFPDQVVGFSSPITHTVSIKNTSQAILTISSISITGDFTESDDCSPKQLTPAGGTHDNCTVTITFTPTDIGSRTGTLTVTDDAPDSPQVVSLNGNGIRVAPATIAWTGSPNPLDFGTVNVGSTSGTKTITVTNADTSNSLMMGTIAATGDYQVSSNNCTSLVLHGANCTVSVTFTPTAAGTRQGTLVINGNATNLPISVQLTGTGNGTSTGGGGGTGGGGTGALVTASTTNLSAATGGTATLTLTLGSGVTDAVTLSWNPNPAPGVTCAITPFVLTSTASSANVTLTVAAQGDGSGKTGALFHERSIFFAVLLPFGIFGLGSIRKRRIIWIVFTLILLVTIPFFVGCGGGGTTGGTTTQPKTYQIPITATAGSSTQTVNVSLTVM